MGEYHSSAEMQSLYSTAPANGATSFRGQCFVWNDLVFDWLRYYSILLNLDISNSYMSE